MTDEVRQEAIKAIAPTSTFERLSAVIYVFGINKAIWQFVNNQIDAESDNALISLSKIVTNWNIDKRAWKVLELRAGFVKRHSYDEIGVLIGGVGRARIQQILQKTFTRLEEGMCDVVELLKVLEEQVSRLWPSAATTTSINSAVLTCFAQQDALLEHGWETLACNDIRLLLLSLRALVNANMQAIPNKLPRLSYFACSLSPEIVKHPKIIARIANEVAEDAARNPRWTYELLAAMVLQEAAEPLHFKEIFERANQKQVRTELNLKGIHNVLLAKPEKFAHVSQGTYGLTAWGLTSVDSYNNIIAEALKQANRVLTLNEISFYVSDKRQIKPQSLQMTLDLHPRFYRTAEGTYGLRARLPSRAKQTLRTPTWLIEDPASHERLEKAIERGYDVEAIIAQDHV